MAERGEAGTTLWSHVRVVVVAIVVRDPLVDGPLYLGPPSSRSPPLFVALILRTAKQWITNRGQNVAARYMQRHVLEHLFILPSANGH